MLQKGWSRPVTDSSFFLDEKLEWMEKNRIDHAVVLNLSQLYGNGLRLKMMKKALRFQNDFNAKIQQDHSSKFTCGFVIHPDLFKVLYGKLKDVLRMNLNVLCLQHISWTALDSGEVFLTVKMMQYSNWQIIIN